MADAALADPLNQWWVGGMVHLWFLPALMLAVLILALCLQARRPGLALALGASLYLLALLGGSYGKPVLGAEWAVMTRNGPFFSLLVRWLALGFMIRVSTARRAPPWRCVCWSSACWAICWKACC